MSRTMRATVALVMLCAAVAVLPAPAAAASVTGTVSVTVRQGTQAVKDAVINAAFAKDLGQPIGDKPGSQSTDASGSAIFDAPVGDYLVYARVGGLTLYAGDVLDWEHSQSIPVLAGQTTHVTFNFPKTGVVSGQVTVPASLWGKGFPIYVDAFALDGFGRPVAVARAGQSGLVDSGIQFVFAGVPTGEVIIRAYVSGNLPGLGYVTYQHGYWGDTRLWWEAEPLTVTAGASLSGVDIALPEPVGPDVVRMGGADRFATAVAVSRQGIPDASGGVSAVFIASGLDFPDALSAGPAAAGLGPVLLVTPTSIPPVVYDEIVRLQPQNIVVVGGVGAVGESVEETLSHIAPVTRIAGANRYAVSRAIARTFFADGSEVAMVASGVDFPDALSAGAFAGAIGAPVILIDPHAESLDSGTVALIRDLGVRTVYVMGGPGAVSQSLAAQLARIPGVDFLTRRGGVDRFETSAFTPSVGLFEEVFIANGFGFADALAGTWLAAGMAAPVLLVQRDCIPFGAFALDRAQTVYALGGTASLSPENLRALPTC